MRRLAVKVVVGGALTLGMVLNGWRQPAAAQTSPAAPDQPTSVVPDAPDPPPPPVESTETKLTRLLAGTAAPPPNSPVLSGRPQRAVEEFEQGQQLLSTFMFAEAVEHLERAARLAPNDPLIRRQLGVALHRSGRVAVAMAHLKAAAASGADDLELQVLLSRSYEADDQSEQAIKASMTALKCSQVDPADPLAAEALSRLAWGLAEAGRHSEALDACDVLTVWLAHHGPAYVAAENAAELRLMDQELVILRAKMLLALDRHNEAVTALQSVRDPSPQAARTLLEALTAAGRLKEAEDLVIGGSLSTREVADVAGAILAGHIRLQQWDRALAWSADLIIRRDAWAEAIGDAVAALPVQQAPTDLASRYADTIVPDSHDAYAQYYILARFLMATGQWELAADALERSVAERPEFVPAHRVLATGWLAHGRVDRASAATERLAEQPGAAHLGKYLSASVQLQAGRDLEAIDLLHEAKALNDRYIPTRLLLAEAYVRTGRPDLAQAELAEVVEARPTYPGALRALYEIMRRQGRSSEFFGRYASRIPSSQAGAPDVQMLRVERLSIEGDLVRAASVAADLARAHPESMAAQLLAIETAIGLAAGERLQTPPSLQSYGELNSAEIASVLNARTDTHLTRARSQSVSRDDLFAGLPLPAWLIEFPVEGPATKRLEVLNAVPQPTLEKALRETLAVIRQWPDALDPQLLMCDLLGAVGRQEEATVAWRDLHDRSIDDQRALWGYATSLAASDRHEELLATMRRLYDANDAPIVRHGLYIALLRTRRYTEAAELLTEWIDETEAGSNRHEDLLKLAVVHFLVGEFEPCRRALARSLGGQSASSGEVLVSPTTVT